MIPSGRGALLPLTGWRSAFEASVRRPGLRINVAVSDQWLRCAYLAIMRIAHGDRQVERKIAKL
jgi:hypothetical protein